MIPIYGLKKMFLLCRSKFSGKTEKLKSN
jgi:hypothetical protein